jgi:hypothetical protein
MSQGYPDFIIEALLDNGFLKDLNCMKNLSQDKEVSLASYISFPRSTDVVNSIKVAICPYQPVNCHQHCNEIHTGQRPCDSVAGLRDRDLFSGFLESGERSAIFATSSSIVEKYYGQHHIYFCYLKVGDEIARLEMPQWVALDRKRLELAHALVLDQCRRGHGYPVALAEAHEQAVITGADRQQFARLIEISLVGERLPVTASAKSQSKRTRWI